MPTSRPSAAATGSDRVRWLVVALAGLATGLSWQPYGLWPLLLLSLPAFTLAVFGQPLRRSFGLGYVYGLAMLTVSVNWLHVLGWWVAALLIVFMALFFGILGLALSLVSRLKLWPLAAACCWVMVEFAYSRAPFGGFGWTRIAYAAVDTPLAGYLPMIGVVGLSFLVALRGPADRLGGRSCVVEHDDPSVPLRIAISAGLIVVLLLGGTALRSYQPEPAVPAAGHGQRRRGPGQRAGPGDRGAGPGPLGDEQPPDRDRRPDGQGAPRPGADAGLHPLAGELDRHRPAARPVTRSVVWSAARIAGPPDPRRRGHRGPGRRRAADHRHVVGPVVRGARDLPQAQPRAVR